MSLKIHKNNSNNNTAFQLKADHLWTGHTNMLLCSCDLDPI